MSTFSVRTAIRSELFQRGEQQADDSTSVQVKCLKCDPAAKAGTLKTNVASISNSSRHLKRHHSEAEAKAFLSWLKVQRLLRTQLYPSKAALRRRSSHQVRSQVQLDKLDGLRPPQADSDSPSEDENQLEAPATPSAALEADYEEEAEDRDVSAESGDESSDESCEYDDPRDSADWLPFEEDDAIHLPSNGRCAAHKLSLAASTDVQKTLEANATREDPEITSRGLIARPIRECGSGWIRFCEPRSGWIHFCESKSGWIHFCESKSGWIRIHESESDSFSANESGRIRIRIFESESGRRIRDSYS